MKKIPEIVQYKAQFSSNHGAASAAVLVSTFSHWKRNFYECAQNLSSNLSSRFPEILHSKDGNFFKLQENLYQWQGYSSARYLHFYISVQSCVRECGIKFIKTSLLQYNIWDI